MGLIAKEIRVGSGKMELRKLARVDSADISFTTRDLNDWTRPSGIRKRGSYYWWLGRWFRRSLQGRRLVSGLVTLTR